MAETRVTVAGMTCEDCERHVAIAFKQAGAREADAGWRTGQAVVEGDGLSEQKLAAALEGTQYTVTGVSAVGNDAPDDPKAGTRDYDLIVIGSGGAAFAGAIRARDSSRRVLMVEHGTTGGTCVNVGCIPSKTLLVSSERARHEGKPSLAEAFTRKAHLVEELRQSKYVDLIDEYGIDYHAAHARLVDAHTIAVDGEEVTANAILIATGARPAVPSIPGLEDAGYLTSTTALELTEAPPRLAVIGANAVGLELGQMLGNFGSRVTFIARRDIGPSSEPEISAQLREILEGDGHQILAPAITTEVALDGTDKVLRGTVDGEPFERRVDEILAAVGRQPNTEELGLAEVGVAVNGEDAIAVDEHQRTSVPSIYAAGDVTAQPRFVYVAAAGGAAAVQNALLDGDERLDFRALPQIIFTSPAIARAGLTESAAIENGLDVHTRVLPLEAIPRALVNGDTRGLFKLIAETDSGRLVGVSILADGAPDVIQAAVLAIQHGMTVDELGSVWAPYLAMAEGLKMAAQTFTRDVSKLSCCAA